MKPRNYILAVFLCLLSSVSGAFGAAMPLAPQGPLGGAQIATIQTLEGDVRVARAATPNNVVRITATGFALANGDTLRTLQGKAEVRFNDNSIISLDFGTVVQIQERPTAGGVQRTIQQVLGKLWFNIERVTGTTTTLQTPTAVAAIRGTTGTQDVPNPDQSTHALSEGQEQVTESVTQQSVTLNAGQRVTAIRGIGFTPVVALAAALVRPVFGGGGGGAGGGGGVAGGGGGGVAGGGGGAAGGAGGGAAGGGVGGGAAGAAGGAATTGAAAATTTAASSVSSLAATLTSTAVAATTSVAANVVVPFAAQTNAPPQSSNVPLNPPGGAIKVAEGKQQADAFVQNSTETFSQMTFAPTGANYSQLLRPKPRFMTQLGGAIPMTAASGSLWAIGALTHNEKAARTGQLATQAVLTAQALSGGFKIAARSRTQTLASAEAMRTFAFATVIRREYKNKPLAVIGSYGFATAVSLSGIGGQRQTPSQVLFGAIIGEVIGRIITHPTSDLR